jgi:AraC-like DNA-binding protein
MLRNKEGLVYEVAYKVGFGSEKYFSRAFKDKFGVPPSQVSSEQ